MKFCIGDNHYTTALLVDESRQGKLCYETNRRDKEDLLKVNSKEVSKKNIYDNEAYKLEQSYIQVIPNEFQH